ncbi:MAG: hypothetical protein AB7O57_17960 [Hyphomicrobiaceae bacterium]
MSWRVAASLLLAVAVAASFASGAHRELPSRRVAKSWAFPGVSPKAIAHGCAAWGEAPRDCLSAGSDPVYAWPTD